MRLIDADAIQYEEILEPMGNGMYCHANHVYEGDIDAQPTVESVPVIRCKDCKHHHGTDWEVWDYRKTEDDKWCAWAERREK